MIRGTGVRIVTGGRRRVMLRGVKSRVQVSYVMSVRARVKSENRGATRYWRYKMVKWKATEEVRLEEIKQVVGVHTALEANKHLKEGWVLLSVGVVPLGNMEGGMKGSAYYVLGRKNVI